MTVARRRNDSRWNRPTGNRSARPQFRKARPGLRYLSADRLADWHARPHRIEGRRPAALVQSPHRRVCRLAREVSGGTIHSIGQPPSDAEADWVALIQTNRCKAITANRYRGHLHDRTNHCRRFRYPKRVIHALPNQVLLPDQVEAIAANILLIPVAKRWLAEILRHVAILAGNQRRRS